MSAAACRLDLGPLLAWHLDDLPEAEAAAFENHLFSCPECARRLDALEAVRTGVQEAARRAAVGGNVAAAYLARAERDGLSVREYLLEEGASVACTAGPEDLVLVRLPLAGTEAVEDLQLRVVFEDLERDQSVTLPPREVVVDRDRGEVVLVLPGDTVRAYPRSRWTLVLRGASDQEPGEAGPFVMDHHPAEDV